MQSAASKPFGVREIPRTLRDNFHQDEVLRRHDADIAPGEPDAACASERAHLERQQGEDHIRAHAALRVNRQDTRLPDKTRQGQ